MCHFEEALFCRHGAGKGPFHVAKELAFEQGRHQGTAIAGEQAVILATAEPMNRPGRHLLAGAALAGDQHGSVGGSHPLDQREDALHRATLADDAFEPVVERQFLPQGCVLPNQSGAFGDLPDDHLELIWGKRLAQIVGCPALHGLHSRLHGGVPGNHHHLARDAGCLEVLEDLQAVHFRHDQVEEDDVELARQGCLEARLRILTASDLMPVGSEDTGATVADDRLVVDDEDPLPGSGGFVFGLGGVHWDASSW